jgi:hypothetical protein
VSHFLRFWSAERILYRDFFGFVESSMNVDSTGRKIMTDGGFPGEIQLRKYYSDFSFNETDLVLAPVLLIRQIITDKFIMLSHYSDTWAA